MNVFLSHINAEAQLASVLKQWIESSLDHDVHVSSEAEGEQRLAEIGQSLGKATLVLILCSARSIGRPWINFEAGCAWVNRVPVIAVCHSGCSKADLPPPLGNFPALELTDAISCEALLKCLANHLQKKRIPRINYDQMVAELQAAARPSDVAVPPAMPPRAVPEPPATRPSDVAAPAPMAPAPAPMAPSPATRRASTAKSIEAKLLVVVQRAADFTCTATDLAARLGERERKVRNSLDKLVNNQLLSQRASTHPGDPDTRYALTDKGRIYLRKHAA